MLLGRYFQILQDNQLGLNTSNMMRDELGATVGELGVVAMISMSHMAGPNHWLPYGLMGAAQHWGVRKTVLVST